MTDLTLSPDLLRPVTPQLQNRTRETAEAFEASFLSQMLKPMFEGISTEAPFGGGEAEATWRGFLIDAMAKQTAKAGGIGLADHVMAEMLKMQEQGA
ncbi:rod-binding protein [Rhizobium sp. CRIBSB]|nr:rod-binding protein [Rhizobium sp. CRIBSB]